MKRILLAAAATLLIAGCAHRGAEDYGPGYGPAYGYGYGYGGPYGDDCIYSSPCGGYYGGYFWTFPNYPNGAQMTRQRIDRVRRQTGTRTVTRAKLGGVPRASVATAHGSPHGSSHGHSSSHSSHSHSSSGHR